ncbi:MAG: hypothetical protein ABW168_10080 [Sedimenticola sp.]
MNRLKDVNGKFNYVVTENGNLVVGRIRKTPGGGHIDLSGGNPVQAAGEFKVVNGELKFIDNASGHFEPVGARVQSVAEQAFQKLGFETSNKFVHKAWVPDPKLKNGGAWRPVE